MAQIKRSPSATPPADHHDPDDAFDPDLDTSSPPSPSPRKRAKKTYTPTCKTEDEQTSTKAGRGNGSGSGAGSSANRLTPEQKSKLVEMAMDKFAEHADWKEMSNQTGLPVETIKSQFRKVKWSNLRQAAIAKAAQ